MLLMRRTSRIILTSLILIFGPLVQFGYASKSPYDSGYDHGCYDAGISDSQMTGTLTSEEKGQAFIRMNL
jgi:hypothetical protein